MKEENSGFQMNQQSRELVQGKVRYGGNNKRKTPKIDRGVEGDPGHQLGRSGAQNDAF